MRDEVPSQTYNMFQFTDVDRDGMVDMLFMTKSDLSLHIFYNKLGQAYSTKRKLCHESNRSMSKIKDVLSTFSANEDKYVVKQLFSGDTGAVDVYSEDNQHPGRLYLGDITSDGYPDILLTVKYNNGTTKPHILVNS